MLDPFTRVVASHEWRQDRNELCSDAPRTLTKRPLPAMGLSTHAGQRFKQTRRAERPTYIVSSDIRMAPLRLGSTAEIFSTLRVSLSIHTVCLSASFSAETISIL